MGRLYGATGDGIARLDEADGVWTVELSLIGSGARCLAVDSADPETVFAGLPRGGVRGLNALKRLVLGSVSTKVLHQAPCDVLVVK
jgi:hypothetical protein